MGENMQQRKILIIEDDSTNCELLVDLLTGAGYDTIAAGSAEEGVVFARMKRPDLALMDLALPGMDGLSATKLLKSDPRTRDIPVIAVTAHSVNGTASAAARDAGCCAFIAKPIDTRKIVEIISEVLAGESLHRSAEAA
jgi:CheY-like chemotaxis protein